MCRQTSDTNLSGCVTDVICLHKFFLWKNNNKKLTDKQEWSRREGLETSAKGSFVQQTASYVPTNYSLLLEDGMAETHQLARANTVNPHLCDCEGKPDWLPLGRNEENCQLEVLFVLPTIFFFPFYSFCSSRMRIRFFTISFIMVSATTHSLSLSLYIYGGWQSARFSFIYNELLLFRFFFR